MGRLPKIASAIALFAICSTAYTQPRTPLQVSEAFWDAVQGEDAAAVRSNISPSSFDDAQLTDNIMPVSDVQFGRIVIDGDHATVDTTVNLDGDRPVRVPLKTVLVREQERWLVDYDATVRSVRQDSSIAQVMDGVRRFSEEFAEAMDESVTQLERRLPQLQREFEQLQGELQATLPELQRQLEEFGRRMEEALRDPKARPAPAQPIAI